MLLFYTVSTAYENWAEEQEANAVSRKKEKNNEKNKHFQRGPTSVRAAVYLQELRYELQECVKKVKRQTG